MNSKQSNKLDSYSAVTALLEANPEIVNVPGLPEKVTTLSARVGEINGLAVTQTQPLRASITERDLVLNEMADTALEIAGIITALARDTKVPQLAEAVEVGRSSFRRARRGHRVWFAQRVLETAATVLSQLGAYGVTAETLAGLEARIDAARVGANLPRNAAVAKKAATGQLASLFKEVDELLKDRIDRLVFPLRKLQPAFYARYQEARSILDRRGAQRGLTGPRGVSPVVREANSESGSGSTPSSPTVEKQAA